MKQNQTKQSFGTIQNITQGQNHLIFNTNWISLLKKNNEKYKNQVFDINDELSQIRPTLHSTNFPNEKKTAFGTSNIIGTSGVKFNNNIPISSKLPSKFHSLWEQDQEVFVPLPRSILKWLEILTEESSFIYHHC